MANKLASSVHNIAHFISEWNRMRSNDKQVIYSLHMGTDREAELTMEDLQTLLAAGALLQSMTLHSIIQETPND